MTTSRRGLPQNPLLTYLRLRSRAILMVLTPTAQRIATSLRASMLTGYLRASDIMCPKRRRRRLPKRSAMSTVTGKRVWQASAALVVIGVHTPEFSFEGERENVEQAVQDQQVTYPVAIDSDYNVWNAFDN